MRTLLIDNYDSFTFNLHHYLARVNGTEPVVMRNDDPRWDPAMLAEFDNVVLSPGPGHPGRPADFGICREITERADLPTLGICLGHQGLALAHGGTVSRAAEPRHGRTSTVRHTGTGLFRGLPESFDVVRYHSLVVTDLPHDMEAVAWTEDGILMGHRHRSRPQWGVQFHPESILTQYGHELLVNFRELTDEWQAVRGAGRRPAPRQSAGAARRRGEAAPGAPAGPGLADGPEGPVAPAAPKPRRLRVLAERLPTRWDDEVVHQRLFGTAENAFWLDSSRSDAQAGRFSVMGAADGPLARVAKADVWSRTVTVESAGGLEIVSGGFLDWLDRDLRDMRTELPPLPFDFTLGWVGYLGYELKAECGGEPVHQAEDPDAAMVFADRAVVLDHLTGLTYLLALAEDDDEDAARAWLTATTAELESLAGVLAGEPTLPAPTPAGIRLRHERDSYLRLIDACQEEIAAGETYEICLTNLAVADGPVDPWEGYRALRRFSPAPYAALLRFGALSVLSTSPERFLRLSAEGVAESMPIKGTRPRGATVREDAEIIEELRTSEKDRAENLMIVDLVRNDLGRHAETGSVEVSGLFDVETYATVHQLVSTVRARLRTDRSAVDLVRAAFPAGSMTGAPKIRTMQIIDRLEAGPRGVYSGAIGYFSLSGAVDLSVAIRTAVVTPGRVRYGVGGAVVALSDAEAEFEETAVKAAPLLMLTGADFPGRRSTDAVHG
ncbi:aminodeoxychorismate synthase component I [Streptomyces sp. ISL-66]|uniref:aminodeoxychorismate synthase component I n=1 Tax=Streptomyces sp. ISL-66 TaxID=2819186 RepID=UPI001BE571B2|nr:aminodeoxychorismate synthase component I [Streptomyces sp. ISL-66]MBT2469600.1 aminodeoxychorismate synthase component I [Streptomyces sp. ISL-66]